MNLNRFPLAKLKADAYSPAILNLEESPVHFSSIKKLTAQISFSLAQ